METVARNTCYLKVKDGGINLLNFRMKCQALRVAGMISTLVNLSDSSFYLCRFYVGRRLSTLRPEWRSLTSNLIPNAVMPSKFYSDCISVLSSLRLTDENLNSKTFYNLLLSKESSSPLLSRHWMPVLGPGFSPTNLWSRVREVTCFEADKACNLNKRNDKQKSYKSHSYIKHTSITIDHIKNTLGATT